jgi:hypothetical protein
MKVTIDDLKRFSLYDSLPDKLKTLEDGQFYVYYYNTIDATSSLEIFSDEVTKNVNISLYREVNALRKKGKIGRYASATVGYFAFDSFESRCGMFYLFLNTFCERDLVDKFYEWCVTNDVAGDIAISTSAMNDIYERSQFERVIAFFSTDSRISSIMRVYDIIDGYLKSKGAGLYGGYIKRVVQIIPYEGGVLPERNGELRFMIIGEKSALTEVEADLLEQAKVLLRSLVTPLEIYKATGWYFNISDGKFRRNIADKGAYIASDYLIDFNGSKVYCPPSSPIGVSQIESLFRNPEKIYEMGYAGKLSDVIKHPTLYQRYPVLSSLPILYRNNPNVPFGQFYQSANSLGGYMVIDGNGNNVNLASVILHETQHAIQRIEGFATGGNDFLAKFVMSIGGDSVRRVFFRIKQLKNSLLNRVLDESAFDRLKGIVSRLYSGDENLLALKKSLTDYTSDFNNFRDRLDTFAMYSAFYLSSAKQLASGEYIEYLDEVTDGLIYELTEAIDDGMEKSKTLAHKLMQEEGYKNEDVQSIFFNAYEDLMGETESRSVQHQMMVDGKYSGYFYLYSWENAPARSISVINDEYIDIDSKTILGAVETIRDGYILHFKQSYSVEPFLHELGHIVDDIICANGGGVAVDEEYAKAGTTKSRSEFFVDCFLGYVRDNVFDNNIQKDLLKNFSLKRNVVIDSFLNEIMGAETVSKDYLRFVEALSE